MAKTDCYFYKEENNGHEHYEFCDYDRSKVYNPCRCLNCENYIQSEYVRCLVMEKLMEWHKTEYKCTQTEMHG